jgi:hypothetical protein
MADRGQLLNDLEAGIRIALDDRLSKTWTTMPGIITKIDLTRMTCSVQVTIQGMIEDEKGVITPINISELGDVPIVFPTGGGFTLTFPLAVNDEVLVCFADRCIDSWWQSGGYKNKPMEARMHDLSDGFAIPGPKSLPNILPAISSSEVQLRNKLGTVVVGITAGGKISIKNTATDLKEVLTDLQSLLNTFMGTLAGFSGGGAATSQAMIQAPAATAQAALVPLLVKIGALLK